MFSILFSEKSKRKKQLENAPEGPLKQYLSVPLPDIGQDIDEIELLALDFETSGLNAAKDSVLSIGHVEMAAGEIRLATAHHQLLKSHQALPEESVIIHSITDDQSAAGLEFEDAIGQLLQTLTGKVMVAHNAKVETGFLVVACQKLYGVKPFFPAIDTMMIAKRWMERRNKEIGQGDLRLFNLRKQYNLPVYQAHNALSDAIATAELFQAQLAHMDSRKALPLKQFLN